MNSINLISIVGNISQSLYPVQQLITGAAYLLGLLFCIKSIAKFKTVADRRAHSPSQEKMFAPMTYLLIGVMLIYLPTALNIAASTAFGVGNVLTYTPSQQLNITNSIQILIQTAGILWFVRGSVLVAHASQPGTQHGPKGMAFIIAGILAMNFNNTSAMIYTLLDEIMKWTVSFKNSQGY